MMSNSTLWLSKRAGRPAEQVEGGLVVAGFSTLAKYFAFGWAFRFTLMPMRASMPTTAWQIASSLT